MHGETDNRFSLDAWHDLIYTSAAGSGRYDLYIDGKPQHMHVYSFGGDTDFFYADVMRGGDDLQIGAKSDSHAAHSGFFHGAMRNLIIFDQALSPDWVAALDAARRGGVDVARNPWVASFVAGYHMDEGQGTTLADFSGHGHDGTLHGGLKWTWGASAVPHAGAMHFDGTRYATLPQSTKFTSDDFTISLWFYPAKERKYQFLFLRGFGGRDQKGDIGLKIHPYSGDLDFVANTEGYNQWIFGRDAPESRLRSAFRLKAWNHAVVTRRGDTYTMWMNGARVSSERSPADISDLENTNPFLVGACIFKAGCRTCFTAIWTSSASLDAVCPTPR